MSVLTLQEAADELGVHYMTAYRYVRLGQLAAAKVGGTWSVDSDELDRFRTERETQPRAGRSRPAPWAERLESRLIAGDAAGAWGVVESALAAGTSMPAIYLEVLTPAMVSIGERWEAGELDISIEHRASGIAMRMIGRLGHHFTRRGRTRGAIIVGAPAGERHALPTAMLGDLLRLNGWDVSDLGADLPTDSLLHAVGVTDDVRAVGLSVTSPGNLDAAADACGALRTHHPDLKLIVGGQAIEGPGHAAALGADAAAESGEHMNQLLEQWFDRA